MGWSKPHFSRMLTMFAGVGFLPAIRSAGSPPGIRTKTMNTITLTANSTAIIPMKRRMMKATISGRGPPSVLDPHLGARVERVAQAVAEDVQGEHRQHDRDARHEREPRRGHELLLAARDQVSPGGIGGAHAGTEERKACFGKDVGRDD